MKDGRGYRGRDKNMNGVVHRKREEGRTRSRPCMKKEGPVDHPHKKQKGGECQPRVTNERAAARQGERRARGVGRTLRAVGWDP